jgi:tetratricopeptide (TPR) repeat protein
MSDPLYERYKEALRAGHVAVLRGRLDEAIAAYRDASAVAPERALPHTSLGGVMLDLGRADDALAEFHAALDISPRDEGALIGRAEALVRTGQPVLAAETLDALAEVLASAGRDADAVDTLQRALVLEERGGRRRRYQRALRSLRMSTGDRVSDEAIGRALGLLDAAPAPAPAAPVEASATSEAPPAEIDETAPTSLEDAGVAGAPRRGTMPATTEEVPGLAPGHEEQAGEEGAGVEAVALDATREPTEAPEEAPAPDEPRLLGEVLIATAIAALETGDRQAALVAYRDAARILFDAGLHVAALDACGDALQLDPDDVEVHLLYAAIFRARGWRDLATQRIVNLLRLVDLDDDAVARARICAEIAAIHGDDERLAGLCA